MWAEDRLIQWEVGSLKDHKNGKTSYFTYKIMIIVWMIGPRAPYGFI